MSHSQNTDDGMEKLRRMQPYLSRNKDQVLTTNNGVKVADTDSSLKAGVRGPTLLEDFHLREKITHFDHERIPERVVHARGTGAYGYFEPYESMAEYTKADFLQDPNVKTPVFVRFSTVVGSRGSADTVRDVRGFATKFYTREGNLDIVGNNMPVFFIQDAIKFPDLVHSIKPEPNNEIPQATAAHDTFWDFVVHTPETAHMVMWVMSGRGIPKSYRMMEGFGVNTFRMINAQGKARFVKFHWKPLLGVHSLDMDEAQKLSGKDPDYHRRDLWEAIEQGNYPEYELGVQLLEEEQEFSFDFDILDPTKLWPEELVPVKIIGKMTLNKNVDNFFAETEQVAFCPANIVPGIDFSNDPLLQGRLFSYEDTQLSRLGGPNFREIPINRPVVPVHNNQQDGMHRMRINAGPVSYLPNGMACNSPAPCPDKGFVHYAQRVDGEVVRARSESFSDHFRQGTMFWNSLSPIEKQHTIGGFHFEVGGVKDKNIRQQVVYMFANVAPDLAEQIALGVGAAPPVDAPPLSTEAASPALSQENTAQSPKTRKIAILLENGFCPESVKKITAALQTAGACAEMISACMSPVTASDGSVMEPNKDFTTAASVFYEGVYIPGGAAHAEALRQMPQARAFVNEALMHAKTIAASDEGVILLKATDAAMFLPELAAAGGNPQVFQGVVTSQGTDALAAMGKELAAQLSMHRHWARKK